MMIGTFERLSRADRIEAAAHAVALSAGVTTTALSPIAKEIEPTASGIMAALGARTPVMAFLSDSDFKDALGEAARLIVLDITKKKRVEHRSIAHIVQLPDFREMEAPRAWPIGLSRITENGEIPRAGFGVEAETTSLQTFGSIVSMSREAAINGQWGLMRSVIAELIDAAYREERSAIVAMLNANANLGDGVPAFDASRGNIATEAGVPSVTTLSSAVNALRSFSVVGKRLGLSPAHLAVNSADEVAVHVLMSAGVRDLFERNSARSSGAVFSDPDLTAWYILPDPQQRPVIALGFLDQALEPRIDVQTAFSGSIGIRCRHDFGCFWASPYGVKVAAS